VIPTCDKLHAFADGELPVEEIPAFERHLVGCASCQTELQDVMLLEALGQGLVDAAGPSEPTHAITRARAMRWAVAAGAAAAVAAICTAWRWRARRPRGDAR
jgi:cellulose synthase operon protein C